LKALQETMKLFATLAAVAMTAVSASQELTPETWGDATAGKTVFIKFLAPW